MNGEIRHKLGEMMFHILIAEKDEALRKLLKRVIKRISSTYTVSTAGNGQEALQTYEQSGADLIISNYRMFKMNGPDFVRTLRARGVTIPIVMASVDPGAEQDCYAAGATLFVEKMELIQKLPEILARFLPR